MQYGKGFGSSFKSVPSSLVKRGKLAAHVLKAAKSMGRELVGHLLDVSAMAPSNRPVGNLIVCQLHFWTCQLITQSCLQQVSGLSHIWISRLYVMTHRLCWKCYRTIGNFRQPICKCSQLACNFNCLGSRFGKICNQQAVK